MGACAVLSKHTAALLMVYRIAVSASGIGAAQRSRFARTSAAALLAFGVAVLAYNTLAVLQSAVWSAHELHTSALELSSFYFADEIRTHYAGMMMAVAPAAWERYDKLTAAQLARVLLQMARHANPKALRKHPRSTRNETKKGYVPGALVRRHVATARVLKDGLVK
jgi:hypothetical protein